MRAHAVEMEIVKLRGVGTSAIVMKDLLEKHAVRYRYHVIHISRFFPFSSDANVRIICFHYFLLFYTVINISFNDAGTYVKYEQHSVAGLKIRQMICTPDNNIVDNLNFMKDYRSVLFTCKYVEFTLFLLVYDFSVCLLHQSEN